MTEETEPTYWFVGANLGGEEDKTEQMIQEGVWKCWPDPANPEKYKDKILSMKPGDRIAIKATYVRKNDLPFDNRGKPVSVMGIKALGEVMRNTGDGYSVEVAWRETYDRPREWYFYTSRNAVWQPNLETSAYARALVRFAFEEEEQDVDFFRNEPYWRDRYGDIVSTDSRFSWTAFYQEFATKLLEYEGRRDELIVGLRELSEGGRLPNLGYFYDKGPEGEAQFIDDICPFTLMGAFNRGGTVENRRAIATGLSKLIGLDSPVPEGFDGVPCLNNQKSWFFSNKGDRGASDIDRLWQVFRAAIAFAADEDGSAQSGRELARLYSEVTAQRGVGWNLSMGLFWIRPWNFLSLDKYSRSYLKTHLGVQVPHDHDYKKLDGEAYLNMLEQVQETLEESDSGIRSFPELSYRAWTYDDGLDSDPGNGGVSEPLADEARSYTVKNILEEGCFFPESELQGMIQRLQQKKNIILQGAPGTGKTWLSKRLAFALMQAHQPSRVLSLQFHPTLSYEDFVRGWRPGSDAKLQLVDGPFMDMVNKARSDPDSRYVVVIEEINRGNPAQIFGEMLTLIEADKRDKAYGLRLSHMREGDNEVFVPRNLYVIGTMNVADRSLALVDFALRRRFAFFDLEPQLNEAWERWVVQNSGFDSGQVRDIGARLTRLNETIANDESLGPQFRVGHSYVTPTSGGSGDVREWFRSVVKTEIQPLLEEYWFDRPEEAEKQAEMLLEGW